MPCCKNLRGAVAFFPSLPFPFPSFVREAPPTHGPCKPAAKPKRPHAHRPTVSTHKQTNAHTGGKTEKTLKQQRGSVTGPFPRAPCAPVNFGSGGLAATGTTGDLQSAGRGGNERRHTGTCTQTDGCIRLVSLWRIVLCAVSVCVRAFSPSVAPRRIPFHPRPSSSSFSYATQPYWRSTHGTV